MTAARIMPVNLLKFLARFSFFPAIRNKVLTSSRIMRTPARIESIHVGNIPSLHAL